MAIISIGDQVIHDPIAARPDTEAKAIGFAMWDDYIALQLHREEARRLWTRIEGLQAKIARNRSRSTKSSINRAETRIDDLRAKVLNEQYWFLQREWDANARWVALSPTQREEEWVDQMFEVPADQDTILGMWSRGLGQSPAPPPRFTLDTRVYDFIKPEHAKVYADRWAWYSPDTDIVPKTVTPKGGRKR